MIFLHRLHSLRPFSRHYSHSLNPVLDLLTITKSASGEEQIIVDPSHAKKLLPVLKAYHAAQEEGTLLSVDFQTVNDYLWLLRAVTGSMASLGRRGMFYLAAAVSDFFLPEDRVVSIRSADRCKGALAHTRPSTRSSRTRAHCLWKWTKCPRSSSLWSRSGHQKATSSASRCVNPPLFNPVQRV